MRMIRLNLESKSIEIEIKWIRHWNGAMQSNERQYYKGPQLEGFQTPGPLPCQNQRYKKEMK